MNETSKVLNQDEKVIWEGQPQFWSFILGSVVSFLSGLPFIAIGIFFAFAGRTSNAPTVFYIFGGLPILIGAYTTFWGPIYNVLRYKYVWYTFTDKRAVFQTGFIGRKFDYADYDKVESATVSIGIMDKVFGKNSGSIAIYANRIVSGTTTDSHGNTSSYTRNVPFVLSHITDPYNVFELFKKTSFDVKADINYPNVLRPKEDTGYQTEYKPEDQNKPQP